MLLEAHLEMNKNKKPTLFIRTVCLVCFLISSACFIVGCIRGSMALIFIGIPCYINILVLIHELGHATGCMIRKAEIIEIRTPILTIKNKSVMFLQDKNIEAYCSFKKKKNNTLIFAFGPLFSFAFSIIMACLWLWLKGNVALTLAIVSTLHFAKSIIPIGNSDMNMILAERRKEKDR